MNVEELLSQLFGAVTVAQIDLTGLIRVVFTLAVGLLVIRILMKIVDGLVSHSKNVSHLSTYIHSVAKVVLYLLLALMLAGSLGIDVTAIIALFSVAGLAVSLALQNTLANLAGGIMLLVTRPLQVGDFVEANGVMGTVTRLDLVYTAITTGDNKEVFIPNSELSTAKITNFNRLGRRRIDLTISVSYDNPTQQVKRALEDSMKPFPQILEDPAPSVFVAEYGESAINYTLRAWTSSGDYWTTYCGLMEEVRESFARHGVEMPYNHLNVHLVKD